MRKTRYTSLEGLEDEPEDEPKLPFSFMVEGGDEHSARDLRS